MINHNLAVEIRPELEPAELLELRPERPREEFVQENEAHRVQRLREAEENAERRLHIANFGVDFRKLIL
jgi:hypothetical protein